LRFQPGSPLWLLRHELKLAWRGFSQTSLIFVIGAGFLWLVFHLAAYAVMRSLTPEALAGPAIIVPGFIILLGLTLMLSSAVVLAINALHDRGDLDLLISSPLPAHTIFAARGAGVAMSAIALPAILITPFAHAGIFAGRWSLIAAYPTLVAIGLGVAGIAFALTLQLVRWLGARRARVAAQILGAVIGAGLFLGFQSFNLLSDGDGERQVAQLTEILDSPWLGPDSVLWWPLRALFGDPLPLVVTLLAGTGLFIVVIRSTSRIFVEGTQQSVSNRVRPVRTVETAKFQRGLARNILRKELRLIARDPNLIANTLLQALYLVPIFFLMLRNGEVLLTIAPAAVLLFSNLSGNLAWITISGEEALDLIGSAPVDRTRVRWLKAAAAVLPVALIAVPFVIFYLLRSPLLAPVFAAFVVMAVLASAMIQVWGGRPAGHRDLKLRQKQNVGLNLLEAFGAIAIAGACYLAMIGSWWTLAPLALGFVAPVIAWGRRRSD
jgi:ABC-2 type transport system permease protein